mgnify:CR=1 FL=1
MVEGVNRYFKGNQRACGRGGFLFKMLSLRGLNVAELWGDVGSAIQRRGDSSVQRRGDSSGSSSWTQMVAPRRSARRPLEEEGKTEVDALAWEHLLQLDLLQKLWVIGRGCSGASSSLRPVASPIDVTPEIDAVRAPRSSPPSAGVLPYSNVSVFRPEAFKGEYLTPVPVTSFMALWSPVPSPSPEWSSWFDGYLSSTTTWVAPRDEADRAAVLLAFRRGMAVRRALDFFRRVWDATFAEDLLEGDGSVELPGLRAHLCLPAHGNPSTILILIECITPAPLHNAAVGANVTASPLGTASQSLSPGRKAGSVVVITAQEAVRRCASMAAFITCDGPHTAAEATHQQAATAAPPYPHVESSAVEEESDEAGQHDFAWAVMRDAPVAQLSSLSIRVAVVACDPYFGDVPLLPAANGAAAPAPVNRSPNSTKVLPEGGSSTTMEAPSNSSRQAGVGGGHGGVVDGYYELPACLICLDRLDATVSGLLHARDSPCDCIHMMRQRDNAAHIVQCRCVYESAASGCPVCQAIVGHVSAEALIAAAGSAATRAAEEPFAAGGLAASCRDCGAREHLWSCLICGQIGCSRYRGQHAAHHAAASKHNFAIELTTQQIWDYLGDTNAHRWVMREMRSAPLADEHVDDGLSSAANQLQPVSASVSNSQRFASESHRSSHLLVAASVPRLLASASSTGARAVTGCPPPPSVPIVSSAAAVERLLLPTSSLDPATSDAALRHIEGKMAPLSDLMHITSARSGSAANETTHPLGDPLAATAATVTRQRHLMMGEKAAVDAKLDSKLERLCAEYTRELHEVLLQQRRAFEARLAILRQQRIAARVAAARREPSEADHGTLLASSMASRGQQLASWYATLTTANRVIGDERKRMEEIAALQQEDRELSVAVAAAKTLYREQLLKSQAEESAMQRRKKELEDTIRDVRLNLEAKQKLTATGTFTAADAEGAFMRVEPSVTTGARRGGGTSKGGGRRR